MNTDKKTFLLTDFIQLLRQADPGTAPKWGRMSFQHMVEHMVLIFKNANGKIQTPAIITPADKVQAFQDFIMSDKAFRENTKSPALPEEPMALHYPSVTAGIDKLEKEVQDFFNVYEATPSLTIRNPVFGDLDFVHATTLLYKHAVHHLNQFGLLN